MNTISQMALSVVYRPPTLMEKTLCWFEGIVTVAAVFLASWFVVTVGTGLIKWAKKQ